MKQPEDDRSPPSSVRSNSNTDRGSSDSPHSRNRPAPSGEAGSDGQAGSPNDDPQEHDPESNHGASRLFELQGGPEEPSTFQPEEILAGRFKILRFIARGGVGEVYEAEDLELRQNIALKIVRPEKAKTERAIERFRREIQLARQVTHPNVCRIFDVFYHERPLPHDPQRSEKVLVLTMELLTGESLADRLHRLGPMSPEEALPIVRQMAAALTAAHRAGVIHRDFKSANVMLVPSQEETRAVVTDFGLAWGAPSSADTPAPLTVSGTVVGTPSYMAPEQLLGNEVTPSVDVYALGLVMYEMVTASRPFRGETDLSTAVMRLTEAPPPPRTRIPDLEPEWDRVILRCLEREPADRFATPEEVVKALEGEPVSLSRKQRRHRERMLAALIALVAIIAMSVGFWLSRLSLGGAGPPPERPLHTHSVGRLSVAVLGMKNLSGKPEVEWLSTALAEMTNMELGAGDELRIIPGENVIRVSRELSLVDADSFAEDTLTRIRELLGADYVVEGSYIALGEEGERQIRLHLRLQDAVAGETIAWVTETGNDRQLFDLVSRSSGRLRERLGVGQVSPAAAYGLRTSISSDPEAARLYSEGLTALRLFDAVTARDLLQGAVEADPNHPLAYSALAAAWTTLGYDEKAELEAKRAYDLSAHLPRGERLSVEARYREAAGEWDKAVEIYRSLYRFFPDSPEYGLRLAQALISAGRCDLALDTVGALRRLRLASTDKPRIDLVEASAAESISDFERQLAAAQGAIREGLALGARLLVAEGRLSEARALSNLGDTDGAVAAANGAHRIYAGQGERRGVGRALHNLALVQHHSGDLLDAVRSQNEAIRIFRSLGDRHSEATALYELGRVLADRGDLRTAEARHREALSIREELAEPEAVADSQLALAWIRLAQGSATDAEVLARRALETFQRQGEAGGEALAHLVVARVLHQQAKSAAARVAGDLANSRAQDSRDRWLQRFVTVGFAHLQMMLGDSGQDLAALRPGLEEAAETGPMDLRLRARLVLGQLEIALGEGAAGRERLRRLAREARSKGYSLIADQALSAQSAQIQ